MGQGVEESRSGELLNASYELHERTVPGIVSDSYRATDRTRKTIVQVTLLRPDFALQSAVVQRFLHAGKALTGLCHPNVSQVVAVASDDTGIPFVVEEDVQGERLAQTLRAFPDGMPLDLALRVVSPVVEAIAAAHALGLVHGQLDGDHIVLVKAGAISLPKVVRFGAIAASEPRPAARDRMAPELRGKDALASADVRSDVWAIGALLYETLCGRAPSDSAGAHAVLAECVPDIPAELTGLVERCLERNPSRRPSQAQDVLAELSRVRTSLNPSAPAVASAPTLAREQVAPAAPVAEPAKSADNVAQAFALGATMFQQPAPRVENPRAEPVRAELARAATPRSGAPRATTPPAERPRASDPAPEALPEIKTMSDLADAFKPMEGTDNIVQSETEGAARGRGFRQAMDAAAETSTKKRPRERDERRAAPIGDRQSQRGDSPRRPPAPLLSQKLLKEGNAPRRALTEEQAYALRERIKAAEPRSWRAFGDGLLLAFGIALLFMLPYLLDPNRSKAQAAFGTRAPIAFIGLAVLAITAVVRTSVMRSQHGTMLLGPLSWMLKIVTLSTCILCAAFNLPVGAFGPAEMGARWVLPWAASGFYMASGAWGLLFGLRESANNLVYGVLIGVLFSGGFYGSYRTLMEGVRGVVAARARSAAAGVASASDAVDSLRAVAAGDVKQADAGTPLEGRHEVGNSEADDMRSIEHMKGTQHDQAGTFDELHKQIEKVAH